MGTGNIPQSTRPRGPLEADLNIDIALIDMIKIVQDHIALSFIQTNDLLCHRSVDKQALPSGSGMHSNNRMDTLNVLWSGVRVIAV